MELLHPVFASTYLVCLSSKYIVFLSPVVLFDVSFLVKAMIVIAWNGSGELSAIFQGDVFLKVLSIFITAAVLKLAQGDNALHSYKFSVVSYQFSDCFLLIFHSSP